MTGINPEVTGKKPAQAPSKRLALKAGINPEITGKKAAHKRRRLMFRKDLMEFFKCSSPTIWNWMRLRNLPRPLVVEGRDAWWSTKSWPGSNPSRAAASKVIPPLMIMPLKIMRKKPRAMRRVTNYATTERRKKEFLRWENPPSRPTSAGPLKRSTPKDV
jgi:predicted DNA-binding transcriptional regulator AlpA